MTRTFLVVGCGSIGTRHLRNLRGLGAGRLLATDLDPRRRRAARHDHGAETFSNLDDGLDESPDAVLVCTPPIDHAPSALRALREGAHVFIEKPIATELSQARSILRAAAKARRRVHVGYNLRFEAGLRRLAKWVHEGRLGTPVAASAEFGQFLPDWRPTRNYRFTYTARRASGGGILLDASHEFDALRLLLGSPVAVTCVARRAPHLDADAEGIAEVLLRFPARLVANVHLDFVQHGYERRLKFVGTKGTALWDFGGRTLAVRSGGAGNEQRYALPNDVNRMYVDEMRAFVRALAHQDGRLASGHDAMEVLRIALAAHKSARTGREVRM